MLTSKIITLVLQSLTSGILRPTHHKVGCGDSLVIFCLFELQAAQLCLFSGQQVSPHPTQTMQSQNPLRCRLEHAICNFLAINMIKSSDNLLNLLRIDIFFFIWPFLWKNFILLLLRYFCILATDFSNGFLLRLYVCGEGIFSKQKQNQSTSVEMVQRSGTFKKERVCMKQ